jgi:hypothetical protein
METDRQPAGFAAAGAVRASHERIDLLQNRSGRAKEVTTRSRGPHAAARSLEHDHVNAFFKLSDATAEC